MIYQFMELEKYNRGELAKDILFLIAVGIVIPLSLTLPNLPLMFVPLLKSDPNYKNKRVRVQSVARSLTYLKRERLINIAEKDGECILTLSEDGKRRILKYHIDGLKIEKPKRWDGLWRIVIFDIPEKEKGGREVLREKLKRLGFYQLQKSCFIHPYECKNEVDFIAEYFQISHYVNFILAQDVEGAQQLKKFFDLRF